MGWPAIKVGTGESMQIDGASRADAVARAAYGSNFKRRDLRILEISWIEILKCVSVVLLFSEAD